MTNGSIFERLARSLMSRYLGVELLERHLPGLKAFDLVSVDRQIVGDAKYYSLVHGKDNPPAKNSAIAEHVWLLEKAQAQHRFLIFGNDSRVAQRWLGRFGPLVSNVRFFFADEVGLREFGPSGVLGHCLMPLQVSEADLLRSLHAFPSSLLSGSVPRS
jgi:hypothetical protein